MDLARYGMSATATTLRRHGPSRQLATLLATLFYLEDKSVDDCLDLLDLLMATELIGKRRRGGAAAGAPDGLRWHERLARGAVAAAAGSADPRPGSPPPASAPSPKFLPEGTDGLGAVALPAEVSHRSK